MSTWGLELPRVAQFDHDTISDVILHLRYTARDGGSLLRREALAKLNERIGKAEAVGSVRLFSLRHEFPTEWARFKAAAVGAGRPLPGLTLRLREEHYPFWSRGRLGALTTVELLSPVPTMVHEKADRSGQSEDLSQDTVPGLHATYLEKIPRPAPTGDFTLYFGDNSMNNLWLAVTWGSEARP